MNDSENKTNQINIIYDSSIGTKPDNSFRLSNNNELDAYKLNTAKLIIHKNWVNGNFVFDDKLCSLPLIHGLEYYVNINTTNNIIKIEISINLHIFIQ